ncbi:hypothetical protein BT96DRAFT_414085 [Gymnopus androsaceus JB14]|uniref:Uncharacterized protein n=1 Tax=Gymnopus androsaceus JB14 TaxID=1447944 RepID=A0A6A4GVG2_9AGAR|nr:hypothetical protein BT96DRAFT_414085 [Gymnopus androsaceus JB14]
MLKCLDTWASRLGHYKRGSKKYPPTFDINTHTFTFMTIAVLQNLGLLPSFQYTPNIRNANSSTAKDLTKYRLPDVGHWRPAADLSLQEALYAWFKFVLGQRISILSSTNYRCQSR